MRLCHRAVLAAFCSILPSHALAHKPSDGFLTIDVEGTTVSGQFDLALRDLDVLLDIDRNDDLKVTWGELLERHDAIYEYATARIGIQSSTGPCQILPIDLQISNYSDGAYASVLFETSCDKEPVTALDITYSALFDLDAQHRGLLNLSYRESSHTYVFSSESTAYHFDSRAGGATGQLALFTKEGLNHIFRGYDHILFLIALVLPAVFVRRQRNYVAQNHLWPVLAETLKVVTAFTLAHTLSLCLTTFQVVTPPPARLIESLVAFTIFLTALNNLYPIMRERRWIAGFGFGLIHGIGYASVLSDLGLVGWALAIPLIGFNLGVEVAQAAIVGAFLPIAFFGRKTKLYRWVVLGAGSLTTAILAAIWMCEQIFNISVLNF